MTNFRKQKIHGLKRRGGRRERAVEKKDSATGKKKLRAYR